MLVAPVVRTCAPILSIWSVSMAEWTARVLILDKLIAPNWSSCISILALTKAPRLPPVRYRLSLKSSSGCCGGERGGGGGGGSGGGGSSGELASGGRWANRSFMSSLYNSMNWAVTENWTAECWFWSLRASIRWKRYFIARGIMPSSSGLSSASRLVPIE